MKPLLITTLGLALILPLCGQQKVSDRTSLPAASLDPANDILGIVDVSAGLSGSKKITIDDLFTGWGFTTAGSTLAKAATTASQRTALGLGTAATAASTEFEPALGNPSTNGYVLSSTTAGVRSWIVPGGASLTLASQAEAETGTENTKFMSALRTHEAIAAYGVLTPDDIGVSVQSHGAQLDQLALMSDPPDDSGYVLSSSSGGVFSWILPSGSGDLLAANNLSDLANTATARTNLGLGTAAAEDVADFEAALGNPSTNGYVLSSTTAGTRSWVPPGAGSGDLLAANNLSDLANAATARTNLGLGTAATEDVADFEAALGNPSTNGYVISSTTAGTRSWVPAGITHFTESVVSSSPNATIPVVQLLATNTATNVDIALTPKGTGAVSSHVANSAASGGNKRGRNSTDWQTERTAASQVASGARSTISGGSYNTASGADAAIGGGDNNQASAASSAVGGGSGNQATTQRSAVGGGYQNTASGDGSAIPGGYQNTASGSKTFAMGDSNVASGNLSSATGFYATSRSLYGMDARASGRFAAVGDAQSARYISRAATTNATITELSLDGAAAAASTRIVIPNNSSYSFQGTAVARSSTGDTKTWQFSGGIERGANAAATAIIGSVTSSSQEEAGASTWVLTVDADTTNGALRIQGTGETSRNLRWVATVQTTEVSY